MSFQGCAGEFLTAKEGIWATSAWPVCPRAVAPVSSGCNRGQEMTEGCSELCKTFTGKEDFVPWGLRLWWELFLSFFRFLFFNLYFICVCVSVCLYVCMHILVTMNVWQSEDNFWEVVLSFYLTGPRDQTQVIRLNSKPLPAEPSGQHTFFSLKAQIGNIFGFPGRCSHLHSQPGDFFFLFSITL